MFRPLRFISTGKVKHQGTAPRSKQAAGSTYFEPGGFGATWTQPAGASVSPGGRCLQKDIRSTGGRFTDWTQLLGDVTPQTPLAGLQRQTFRIDTKRNILCCLLIRFTWDHAHPTTQSQQPPRMPFAWDLGTGSPADAEVWDPRHATCCSGRLGVHCLNGMGLHTLAGMHHDPGRLWGR